MQPRATLRERRSRAELKRRSRRVSRRSSFSRRAAWRECVLPALLEVKLAGEMLGVAAEGGGAEAELPGQGAVGDPGHEAAVDLRAGGVVTDGTAFDHTCAPRQEFPQDAGWDSGYQGRGGGASTGGTDGRELARGNAFTPPSPQPSPPATGGEGVKGAKAEPGRKGAFPSTTWERGPKFHYSERIDIY